MMYFGGVVLLGWALVTASGYEPFTTEERGEVPQEVRMAPGGILLWTSSFTGGK